MHRCDASWCAVQCAPLTVVSNGISTSHRAYGVLVRCESDAVAGDLQLTTRLDQLGTMLMGQGAHCVGDGTAGCRHVRTHWVV
jgi:hypothetical protein